MGLLLDVIDKIDNYSLNRKIINEGIRADTALHGNLALMYAEFDVIHEK